MRVRVLNFDDSLTRQPQLLQKFSPSVVDLTGLGPSCRLWAGAKCASLIRDNLKPQERDAITFLGSGDFHHISSLLIEQFDEPLTVIIFDFHPDWDILPPRLGCGSWVSRIIKKNAEKVIILGASSEDISTFSIQTGDLKALRNGRLEIYPYAHGPTRTFLRKVPDNPSIEVKRGIFSSRISWQELKNGGLAERLEGILHRSPARKVYVSIDKDSLRSEYALTNWEEGLLSLDELLSALRVIKDKRGIAGLDITGEYSLPRFRSRLKVFCSSLDHPKDFTARGKPLSLVDAVNEKTNLRILETILG